MAAPLPLLAFKAHVGPLFIAPDEIDFVAELGVGELALVELGRWRRADGLVVGVVVKGWKPHVIATPQDFRELLLEASKLQRLRHPHICRFLGLGCFSHGSLAEVRESMFMVEEYVGTRTLRKLIGEQMRMRLKNLYSMATALRWAAEVADALSLLHEAAPPYIHGDVKADNVFLTDGPDVGGAHAKLGDLKPHRHVYDRAPSTLSQHTHQQQASAAKHPRQGSLAKFSQERGSSCSSSAAGSCPGTPSGLAGCQPLSSSFSAGGRSCGAAAGSDGGGAERCVARLHSMPVPIGARGSRGSSDGGGCAWAGAAAGATDSSSCAGAGAAAADGKAGAYSPCSGDAATAAAAAAAGSPAGEQQLQPSGRRRLGRTLGLSDSASSTTDSNGSVCIVPPRGVPSLAAASDDADDADASTSSRDSSSCDEAAAALQQQQGQQALHALHAPASSVVRVRCCSLPEHERCACGEQQVPPGGQLQLLVSQLLTSKSAPAQLTHELVEDGSDCSGLRDCQVHDGAHLLQLQGPQQQQQQVRAPPSLLQQQMTGKVPSLSTKRPAAAPLCQQPLSPPLSPQQQQQHGGWALSPSGAASPCGAIKSGLLDLFADMTDEDELALSRRWRDAPCQYTLVPGSLVQQRLLPSASLPAMRSHSHVGWEQHAAPLAPAGAAEQQGPLLAQQQQQQQQQASSSSASLERMPSLGKSGAPAAIESKQHGGNSAFAALTAIDVIAEETSSLATESVLGSCCTSRESTAHGGSHFYDSPAAPGSGPLPPTAHLLQLQQLQLEQQRLAAQQQQQQQQQETAAGQSGAPHGLLPLRMPAPAGGGAGAAACSGNDEAAAPPHAAAAAGGQSKRVRFAVERPAGATPSRDFGLLYTAPELLKGHRPTEKVDVFAFGVLLYELFSRSLVVSQCAAVCAASGSGRGRRRGSSKRGSGSERYADSPREQQQQQGGSKGSAGGGSAGAPAASGGPGGDADGAASLPEQQLMLAFAQKVAAGYRLPLPPHFPAPVAALIASCWAAEPHERPRMADVLAQLRAWQGDAAILGPLDSYVPGLADLGFGPKAARPLAGGEGGPGSCGCAGGCVIS